MTYTIQNLLVARGSSENNSGSSTKPATGPTPLTIGLLAALICLILVSVVSLGTLLAIRRYRKAKKAQCVLPTYEDDMLSVTSKANHRRGRSSVTINFKTNATPTFTVSEKEALAEKNANAPSNTLPEIRITFPEEIDESGKRLSGRVVVVHLNEQGGVGLEPTEEEDLPAYQLQSNARFHSLDLDRIGGLREKVAYPPTQ